MKRIALNKYIFKSPEEYFVSLIEMEKKMLDIGYEKKFEELELLKQYKRILKEIYLGENKKIIKIKVFIDSLNIEQI